MARLSSPFPAEATGAALLVLRAAVTLSLYQFWLRNEGHGVVIAAGILVGLVLLAGLFTRAVAGLATCALIVSSVAQGTIALTAANLVLYLMVLMLLGAGAISLDAVLFGHRTVHLGP